MKINDIKKKDIKELMALLLDKNVSDSNKLIIHYFLHKKINSNYSYFENSRKLRSFFSNLKKDENIESYLLYNNMFPRYIKKYILKYGFDDDELQALLKKNISEDLKKYIIKKNFDYPRGIIQILNDDMINDKLKNYCTMKNISSISILGTLLNDAANDKSREYILSRKKIKFLHTLFNTSNRELVNSLSFYYCKYDNVEFIEKYRPNLLKRTSRYITADYIRDVYYLSDKNEALVNTILEFNQPRINKVINNIRRRKAIKVLNVKKLPREYAQTIINNNYKYLNKYISRFSIDEVLEKLSIYGEENEIFKEFIVNSRLDDLIKMLNEYDFKKYFDYITSYYYNDSLIASTINNKVLDEDVISTLKKYEYNKDVVNIILKYKSSYIKSILTNIDWDNLLYNKNKNDKYVNILNSLSSNIQNKICKRNSVLIKEILNKYDKNILKEFLNSDGTSKNGFIVNIQNTILKMFGVSSEKINYCKTIAKYCISENMLDILKKLELFFDSIDMSIEMFFQYSSYDFCNNLIGDIIYIVNNNEINNFIKVKNYLFSNYFDNDFNNASLIINLNMIIKNYRIYNALMLDITDKNIKISNIDRINLNLLFNGKLSPEKIPLNLYELNELKKNYFNKFRDKILNTYTDINTIKNIFFDSIIALDREVFDNVGNTSLLKILQKDNNDNKEMVYLIEEIITSMDFINKLVTTNDREELVGIVVSYIEGDNNLINRMINNIVVIKDKIRKLYELDSMYNLTTLEEARKIPNIYDEKYMTIYGGEVFDFSDKNYVLYAHVISSRESIEELVNGYSNGNNNFISFSPISYRGQKYYYDYCNGVLAYDTIPNNSFICSSLSNMGSNHSMITKNSAIVSERSREQRGILETSSVKVQNAETLLYREGLKPCGLILADGRKPTNDEIMYHNKYNLPFIITQKKETAIDNPKRVFTPKKGKYIDENKIKELDEVRKYIDSKLVIKKENDIYTGREVAIFTDTHAMYEPTIAILEDIRYRGINEIYSLGDNTSLGPNPREVLDLMDKYNVKQIMGNSEYYLTFGGSPFSYWNEEREKGLDWTNDKVQEYINDLKLYKPSCDLLLGGKKIALCHFGNDIRWDFNKHSTWMYQDNIGNGDSANQFLFTNSDEYNKEVEYMINKYGIDDPKVQGYLSSKNTPMFDGNLITSYDEVFQGHVHFALEDKLNDINIHTLRGAGMGELEENKKSMAYYIVLKEKKLGGYDIEKVYVPFNKNSLLSSIYSSDMPTKTKILSYLK